MSLLEIIKGRRSVREFLDEEVSKEEIEQILEAGRWAPSGLNNQPWKFVVIKDKKMLKEVSQFTKYGNIIRGANLIIVVFIDNSVTYDRTKDVQSIGAGIQNMLLQIHSMGLGGCWIGEILNQREKVERLLQTPSEFELMAVVAVGKPVKRERRSTRKKLSELIWKYLG